MDSALTLLAGIAVALPLTGWLSRTAPWLVAGSLCIVVGLLSTTLAGVPGLALLRFRTARARRRGSLSKRQAGRTALLAFGRRRGLLGGHNAIGPLTAALVDAFGVDGAAFYRLNRANDAFERDTVSGLVHAPAVIRVSTGVDSPVVTRPSRSQPPCWHTVAAAQVGGSCLGLVLLESQGPGVLDDSEAALLGALATQIGLALQNAEYAQRIEDQRLEIEALRRRVEIDGICTRPEVRATSRFADIVGTSACLQRVLAVVERTAAGEAPIMITGETGTGKELIARAIHRLSPRRNGPLISVNCPAIPPDLAESELFGHERGAFTHAVESRPGRFELADGGTIFLDEIADLPLNVQAKLLRVLQEHETQRIGSSKVRKLDLRIIAATNRDLQAEMRAHRFREDLYYRLAAVQIELPPLCERSDDIPMLASGFLEQAATAYGRPATGFAAPALDLLCGYSWPGNVRELKNVVERAVLLCDREVVEPHHLPSLGTPATPLRPLRSALRVEKIRRIEDALARTGGNQAAAARLLGMSRSNFFRMTKSLGVQPNFE